MDTDICGRWVPDLAEGQDTVLAVLVDMGSEVRGMDPEDLADHVKKLSLFKIPQRGIFPASYGLLGGFGGVGGATGAVLLL